MPEAQEPALKRQLGPVSHEGKWLLLRKSDFLIELFKFLDTAKGNPVNDRLIPAHCWGTDKCTGEQATSSW
jgi:hypothetical protein